jgi:hypothetical protein
MKRSASGAVILFTAVSIGLACYQDDSLWPSAAVGLTSVYLTDAPLPFEMVDRVEVYVVEIAASTEVNTVLGQQEWLNIATPGRRFDLISLQQGVTELAGEGRLLVGQYEAVRLTINTDSSRVVFAGGGEARVRWPDTGSTPVFALVEEPLAVTEAGCQIVVDFDVGQSFVFGLENPLFDFLFVPFVRAVDKSVTGFLSGMVLGDIDGDQFQEPVENAVITVLRGNSTEPPSSWSITATGHTDPDGRYSVGFLLAGTYTVQVTAPGSAVLGATTTPGVAIAVGQETTHTVVLPLRGG